jgi:HEAT repeat protein
MSLKVHSGGERSGEFVKLLLKAMLDNSWRVRKTAVDILFSSYPMESYIDGIIKLLYIEDNAGARNSAIEILTRLGKRATEHLIKAFDTTSYDVRKFIIDIIGEVSDRAALPLLISALKDDDENVRASAVEHLGTMKETSVVDALAEILKSGDMWTTYPAVEALGKIGDARVVPALAEMLNTAALREPALRALGRISEPASMQHVVPFIRDRSKAVQHEALCSLEMFYRSGVAEEDMVNALKGHFGSEITGILLEHAQSSRSDVKVTAILFLGLLKDEKALRPLLGMSEEEGFTEDIKRALIFIGKGNPESLLPLIDQGDPLLLRYICGVFTEVASPLYFDILKDLLRNEDGHIRAKAAIGLSNIGDMRAVDLIKQLLVDPYPDVQDAAVKALTVLKEGISTSELAQLIKSDNPVMRKNAVLLLGTIGSGEVTDKLSFAMKDEDVSVRKAVVTALASLKHSDTVEYLTMALTDDDPAIRGIAVKALQQFGETVSFEPISILLDDSDDMVRVAAIKALGMLGDVKAVSMLVELLSDENGFVVTAAIESLGRLGDDDARHALTGMLHSKDNEFRRTAIRGLSGFEHIEHLLLPFLGDEDWATRVAVVESLSGRRQEDVRSRIESFFDNETDPIVKKAMERYLDN